MLEAGGVIAVYGLMRLIVDPSSAQSVPIIGEMATYFDIALTDSTLVLAAIGLAAFYFAKNVYLAYVSYIQAYFASGAGTYLAVKLFRQYLNSPYSAMSLRNSGDLIVNVNQAPYFIATRILTSAAYLITEGFTIIGIVAVLMITEPIVALVTSLGLSTVMGLFYFSFRPFLSRWGQEHLSHEGVATRVVFEGLRGLKEIRVLGCESFFQGVFNETRQRLIRINTNMGFVGTLPRFVSETLIIWAISFVIILVVGGGRSDTEVLAILGLFAVAGFRLMPSINRLTIAMTTIKSGKAALDQVDKDLREQFDDYKVANRVDTSAKRLPFTDTIHLKDVFFCYPGTSKFVLSEISMGIKKGMFLGIVGSTGAGKTTLIDIIMGLLTPERGEITFDSKPIDTSLPIWKTRFGYVPQNIFLLDDSIRRNIGFGLPDDKIDDKRVQNVAELASIDEMIAGLPDGLDSIVGEDGINLSGGQRQRIGIARALYRDPEILVMDEATSALDTETEHRSIEMMKRLAGEKTIIVIAHRLSTVQHCDQLIFMENGCLVDAGTFDELRSRNSRFNHMVKYAEITGTSLDENKALGMPHEAP